MAEILGGVPAGPAQPAAAAAASWRISDLSYAQFGEVVPAAAVADANVFISRERTALVQLDGA